MSVTINNLGEYSATIELLKNASGANTQQLVDIINQYELTPAQFKDWFSSMGSGVEPWYTSSGFEKVGGYRAVTRVPVNPQAGSILSDINSNAGTTTQVLVKQPIETALDAGGKIKVSSGLTKLGTGVKSGLTFISKEVLPAVSAAGLGIALGKTIDKTLYNLNPDFWDNNGMSSLNPETWGSITSDYPDGFLKSAFNTVFGIDPNTGKTQMYLDERAAAYLSAYMASQGVFNTGEASLVEGDAWAQSQTWYQNIQFPIPITSSPWYKYQSTGDIMTYNAPGFSVPVSVNTYAVLGSKNQIYRTNQTSGESVAYGRQSTLNNKSYYYGYLNIGTTPVETNLQMQPGMQGASASQWGYLIAYGVIEETEPVEGIGNQPNATQPDFSNCDTIQDYIDALRDQYPDLYRDAVEQTYVDPDTGNEEKIVYIPIGTPIIEPDEDNVVEGDQPTTNPDIPGQSQDDPAVDPSTDPSSYDPSDDEPDYDRILQLLLDLIADIIPSGYEDPDPGPDPQPDPNPDTKPDPDPANPSNPDDTGTGSTPAIVPPSGSASALWSVYNPSQAELNSFGAWLWSSNFIDQLLKLFNNPMQSIIGVHKIFAQPQVSGSGNIVVGYLNSGVNSNIVGNQYTDINCGTILLAEQFGNVFDYTDTHIRLYLPFIGIVPLDTADAMRGTITIIYHVDVITGACLADVEIIRDAGGGVLYQFAGDAAVRYPISSGSYMGVVAGIASVAGGVASAIMTGGAALPMAAGAIVGGVSSAKTQVQHSGSFSGNAGAMGCKKPYLIIERPQTMIADNYNKYTGIGANMIVSVDQMSGYFRLSNVKTATVGGATEEELAEIKSILESGALK